MSSAYEFLYQEDLYLIKNPIVIVVDKPWEATTEEEKTLLSKILGSIKLSLDQVAIIHQPGIRLDDFNIYQSCRVISFGVKLSDSLQHYQYHPSSTISFIQADSLSNLTDVTKKSLWVALKAGFLSAAQ
jgi:DNA polymerase III psi subunit